MVASLNPSGRMAIVLDTGAVSRGSGNPGTNRERDIRRAFVEAGLVKVVILLPENLFYNTTAPGVVMVVDLANPHPGEVLLINASQLFIKGKPKNEITDEYVEQIHQLYLNWSTVDEKCCVVTTGQIASTDYNLSPSRYVAGAAMADELPLKEAASLLRRAEAERSIADKELWKVLSELGIK
jgi:type I restriction enzyme M protein